jgi:pyruvate,water dikinase
VTPALVLRLADPGTDLSAVGGKGATLARLAAAGFDVPAAVVVTTGAYRAFVDQHGLREAVLTAAAADPDRAAETLQRWFRDTAVPPDVAEAVRTGYVGLGAGPVAVRSSATAEDLVDASFAGQQDSFLDVSGEAAVLEAVRACWASLWTARAIGYRALHHIPPGDVAMAVVIQRMAETDSAGVLFTADPVTGDRDRVVVNAVRGRGEALVAGRADPQVVVLDRAGGTILQRHGAAVIDDATAKDLARLGQRVEALLGQPVDVEWAAHAGRVAVLQARPITVAGTEEWNDSLTADCLWTCANVGEAIPSVMTPATWSLVQIFMSEAMSVVALGPYRLAGRIAGRFYLNLSVAMAAGTALGLGGVVRRASVEAFGRIPPEVTVPPLPMSRLAVLRALVPSVVPFLLRVRRYQHGLADRVGQVPARCAEAREQIAAAATGPELADLWPALLEPLLRDTGRMLAAGGRVGGMWVSRARPWLRKLVGDSDAIALLTGMHGEAAPLASLGPLVGLDRLARGEIDQAEFTRQWGHRCPDELEISVPRPEEDPGWAERRLAVLHTGGDDVPSLLARQQRARAQAMARFQQRYPHRVRRLHRRLTAAARGVRAREAARSEVVRAFQVLRHFALRAGELTGCGDDVFLLGVDEIVALLNGDRTPLSRVAVRRATYRRYAALPACPTLIRGAFDPFRWAADPHRRGDVFDASKVLPPAAASISGFPGAGGVVEGRARVLTSMEDSVQLQPGEILVTTVTNVGWTPVFPRVAAVVTDVGAPLSHAAIVARELGIPAVVGTGNATAGVRTGDWLLVDGGRGTVQVLVVRRPNGPRADRCGSG